MKKILACLFILALFSAFVFWTGWTQFKLKPDFCGIVISKTHGICEKPVKAGEFSWHKEFLLPTNAQLLQFKTEPFIVSKSYKTSLPTLGTGLQSDFDYNFNYSITLTLSPEEIVSLYSQNFISDNNSLQKYLDGCADYITQLSSAYYIKKLQENPNFKPESVRRDDLIRSIQSYKEYPDVEVVTVALTSCDFPDYELYNQLKLKISVNQDYQHSEIQDFENSGEKND